MIRTLLLALFLLILLVGCGEGLPSNAIPIGTACAEVKVEDYEWTYHWGLNPMTWKYEFHWGNEHLGSHMEERCKTIYTTPTPGPTSTHDPNN